MATKKVIPANPAEVLEVREAMALAKDTAFDAEFGRPNPPPEVEADAGAVGVESELPTPAGVFVRIDY